MYGYQRRRRNNRRCNHNGDDGITTFIALLMMLALALPFAGLYLLFSGKTETQRIIGGVICIVMFLACITSLF